MAIKASATVSLSSVVDVQAVWRYYLLQSSTLTVPAKPTTYPPPAEWGDAEPSFDPTKTETLYVVDCNVFSDGSFAYTNVSISTAFEAAKTAYNKAQNAADNASDALANTDALYELSEQAFSDIARTADEIVLTVSEQYALKSDTDRLVSEISTQIEQTNEDVTIRFNQFSADIEDIVNGTDAEFELIRKYIRFVDGSIMLGELGNELELKISNDRISFLQDNVEVAYFSDNKLYVTDGHFINSLQLGEFAFIPRANGNLSFKKLDSSAV